tara:strand:- start:67 stop:378 length:312 start_codon:yes stop_codon:yes gene_type:complete
MTDLNRLFAPAEGMSNDAIPPRFDEAMTQIQKMNKLCDQAQIPEQTQISALMVELMPRLVKAYGPHGVITMLGALRHEIAGAHPSPDRRSGGPLLAPDNDVPN